MKKRVIVTFRTPLLKKSFDELSEDDPLKKRIRRVIEGIKQNPLGYGKPIAKNKIPKVYFNEGFDNAFWVDLSKSWRLIYSLTGVNEVEILAIILEWFTSHKDYEKRFRY
jgi:Txe/YoeB family toxin of Txe-Axe toxin-antitoxin module